MFSVLQTLRFFSPRPQEAADVNKQPRHCAGLQLTVQLKGNTQLWDGELLIP